MNYFTPEIPCEELPEHPKSVVFSASRCLSVVRIYSSPNAVFDNRLFQLSGKTNCLFVTSISQGTKSALPTVLGFPEDRVIALFWYWRHKVFVYGCCHDDLKAFR